MTAEPNGGPKMLFDHHRKQQLERQAPLAARMRPHAFDEFVDQEHIVALQFAGLSPCSLPRRAAGENSGGHL